jgi:hypothetical protein
MENITSMGIAASTAMDMAQTGTTGMERMGGMEK